MRAVRVHCWRQSLLLVTGFFWLTAAGADEVVQRLPTVSVIAVASRSARSLDDVAATVSLITRKDIEEGLAFNLRDLLRYEPGVTIDANPTRFGLGNLAIRGVDGNRVMLLLDGIRLPDAYRVGSFSNATRDGIDTGLLQRVEILRGPGSALYGSDALAGVLSFSTVDPDDVLRAGESWGLQLDLGATSADEGLHRGVVAASRATPFHWLLGYHRSDARERDNRGGNAAVSTSRTAPNPQRRAADNWLAKLLLPWAGGIARVTLDRHERATKTAVLSLNPQSSRTVRLDGDDLSLRERVSFDVDAGPTGPFDRLRALVYSQRSLTRNDTLEQRNGTTAVCLSAPGSINCLREVRFRFAQKEEGISLLADLFGAGRWVFGVEAARLHAEELRDGQQTILNTGVVSKVVGGEPLPTRDFPVSRSERIGVFAQDEIDVPALNLTLIPALRYDRFRIEPQPDPVFAAANPGRPVSGLADAALSPKLGLLWKLAPQTTLSAQWASGFRAPPAADINIGLASLPAGYAVIPNPDLKSERSHGLELGLRTRQRDFDATATVFRSDYRDLILSRAPLPCPADPRCVAGATGTFQSQNITRARIEGVEGSIGYALSPRWRLRAAATWARGDDRSRAVPLNAIEPPRLTAGLLHDAGAMGLGLGLHITHTWKKGRIDQSSGPYFAAPAYTTVDLTGSMQLTPGLKLSAGLFNVFDETYWLWSDLRGVPRPGASVDRYTQPGRNASVLLRAQF
jgi:hemoglobin/transferrin/lactoferrin receptor protein